MGDTMILKGKDPEEIINKIISGKKGDRFVYAIGENTKGRERVKSAVWRLYESGFISLVQMRVSKKPSRFHYIAERK